MQKVENLIVGAGPAGLAIAGRMRHQNIPFVLIEKQKELGYSWRNHYDRLHLHTVKQLSALPHLPYPEDYPIYVPRAKVVEYLDQYAQHFSIEPIFQTSMEKVTKQNGHWVVNTNKEEPYLADNVILTTGINRVPNIPTWPNQASFKGEIIHSRAYKNPYPFKGSKVLVVGMGNTGAEIALDLAEKDIDVTVAIRSPICIVPRDVNGRPVQLTAKTLAKIPFGLGDWLGTQIRRFIIGDLTKYGVPLSTVHPTVQLRETGKTPIVDIGTAQAFKDGKIKAAGDIASFTKEGVLFKSGGRQAFNHIILATGYHANLEEFIPEIKPFLDKYHLPKSPIGEGVLKNLFFVGFDNYQLGGILGIIQSESETVVGTINERRK